MLVSLVRDELTPCIKDENQAREQPPDAVRSPPRSLRQPPRSLRSPPRTILVSSVMAASSHGDDSSGQTRRWLKNDESIRYPDAAEIAKLAALERQLQERAEWQRSVEKHRRKIEEFNAAEQVDAKAKEILAKRSPWGLLSWLGGQVRPSAQRVTPRSNGGATSHDANEEPAARSDSGLPNFLPLPAPSPHPNEVTPKQCTPKQDRLCISPMLKPQGQRAISPPRLARSDALRIKVLSLDGTIVSLCFDGTEEVFALKRRLEIMGRTCGVLAKRFALLFDEGELKDELTLHEQRVGPNDLLYMRRKPRRENYAMETTASATVGVRNREPDLREPDCPLGQLEHSPTKPIEDYAMETSANATVSVRSREPDIREPGSPLKQLKHSPAKPISHSPAKLLVRLPATTLARSPAMSLARSPATLMLVLVFASAERVFIEVQNDRSVAQLKQSAALQCEQRRWDQDLADQLRYRDCALSFKGQLMHNDSQLLYNGVIDGSELLVVRANNIDNPLLAA